MSALRTGLFLLWLVLLTIAVGLVYAPALLLPRRYAAAGLRHWSRLVLAGARALCGVRHEIRGREHLPAGAVLIASKHQSMWDTVILPLVLSDPAIILKKELMRIPIYGWYAAKIGMIPIDRAGAVAALKRMVAAAKACAAQSRPIVIFPQGTRVAPGAEESYKPGVAALYRELGLPCVPVAVSSGLFWARDNLRLSPGTIVLEFGPAIAPGLKRDAFMAALEAAIEPRTAALLAEAGFRGAGADEPEGTGARAN